MLKLNKSLMESSERVKRLREDKKNKTIKRLEITDTGVAIVPESQTIDRIHDMIVNARKHRIKTHAQAISEHSDQEKGKMN